VSTIVQFLKFVGKLLSVIKLFVIFLFVRIFPEKLKLNFLLSIMSALDSLNILLNAPSKAAVEQLLSLVFVTRHQSIHPVSEDSQQQQSKNEPDIHNPLTV
jgi:hypothetical protein